MIPIKKNNNQCVETELSRFDQNTREKNKKKDKNKKRKKKENNGRNDEIKTA